MSELLSESLPENLSLAMLRSTRANYSARSSCCLACAHCTRTCKILGAMTVWCKCLAGTALNSPEGRKELGFGPAWPAMVVALDARIAGPPREETVLPFERAWLAKLAFGASRRSDMLRGACKRRRWLSSPASPRCGAMCFLPPNAMLHLGFMWHLGY